MSTWGSVFAATAAIELDLAQISLQSVHLPVSGDQRAHVDVLLEGFVIGGAPEAAFNAPGGFPTWVRPCPTRWGAASIDPPSR